MDTVMETATKFIATMMEQKHLVAYYIGIFFVIVSHLFMLRMPNMYWHSIFNLLAAFLIAYYFVNKEFGSAEKVQTPAVTAPVPAPAPVTAPVPAPTA